MPGPTVNTESAEQFDSPNAVVGVNAFPPFPQSKETGTPFFSTTGLNYIAGGAPFNNGATAFSVDNIRCIPFVPARRGVIGALKIIQTGAGAAGSLFRLGCYLGDPARGYLPGTLLFDSGPIAGDGANVIKVAASSINVTPGVVLWAAYFCGVSAPTISSATGAIVTPFGFNSSLAVYNLTVHALAFGALPQQFPYTFVGGFANGTIPCIWYNYSA